MSQKNRITAAAEEMRRHGGHPRQVCLTPDDAIQLQYELIGQGGPLSHRILANGIGKALPTIDGLTIVWKSQHFAVV